MTDAELIARLLDWEEYDEGDINDAREAAANRIKELKAELAGGSFYQEKDIDALQNRISAQAAEIERLRGDVEKRRETRMSDDDLIRRGDALYAIAGWEIPSTAISALPAVTQPAPDTAADRIEAQAAEIERLRGELAKLIGGSETVLEAWDHHMRDVVVPGSLHDAIEELRADVAEAKGAKP